MVDTRLEQVFPGDGVNIHVCQVGDPGKPPMMLIHGIYDQWESWSLVIDELKSRYHLLLVDLRGHGRSDKPEQGYHPADYAADMAAVLHALELRSVPVIGHSLGAITTAWLAATWPDLVSVAVLEDPPGQFGSGTVDRMQRMLTLKRGPEGAIYKFFRELGPDLGDERWRDQTRRLRNTADGPFEIIVEWAERGNPPDVLGTLAAIQSPTLLMQADPEAGGALPDDIAQAFLLSLQHGELQAFPGVGHNIHKDQPRAFASSVLEFLTRHTIPVG